MNSERLTFLQISLDQSNFLFPIEDVQEVADDLPVRDYPMNLIGHQGVINLRGQVIPVMSLEEHTIHSSLLKSSYRRFVIAQWEGSLFAFSCNTLKKVVLDGPLSDEVMSTKIINLDGKPLRLLSASEIIKMRYTA